MKRTKTRTERTSVTYTFTSREVLEALEKQFGVDLLIGDREVVSGTRLSSFYETSGLKEEISVTTHFDSLVPVEP